MTDDGKCPFCSDVLDGVTCGRRVECFNQAIEKGLVFEQDMTPEEEAAFDAWIERQIAETMYWDTPEGRAEEARIEAEVEAHRAEMGAFDREFEEKARQAGLLCACGRYKPPYEDACFPCRQQKEKMNG